MAEIKVVAPESDFSGVVAGVVFTDGEGKTDNSSALRYFREAGYGVDGSEPVRAGSAEPEESDEEPLDKPKDSGDLVEDTEAPAKKSAAKKAPAKKAAVKGTKKAAAKKAPAKKAPAKKAAAAAPASENTSPAAPASE